MKNFRLHMLLEHHELETYTNVLTTHTNKKSIRFSLYGINKAKWSTLVEMANSLNYSI